MKPSATSLLTTACATALLWTGPLHAQTTSGAKASSTQLGEVIVTARKRQESILNVPVVETALPQVQLERLQVKELRDLPALVPGLGIGRSVLTGGGQISIRGVGTINTDTGVDQSVSYNIDGMSLSNGLALESAMFDVGQVEVLKGPQSLFYGKSSTGGVLSVRTADPTSKREVIARVAYEFEAVNPRAELILSGPVTDTLKMRLSGLYTWKRGYFTNNAVPLAGTGATAPRYPHASRTRSFMVRLTSLWTPNEKFDARLKLTTAEDHINEADAAQLVSCPAGLVSPIPGVVPQWVGGAEDCRLNRNITQVEMDPKFFPGIMNGGSPFTNFNQSYETLEMNYHVQPELTLSSTTSYYRVGSKALSTGTNPTYAGPVFASENWLHRRNFTEELRLNSDYSGPFNFTAGGFYEKGRLSYQVSVPVSTIYTAIGFPADLFPIHHYIHNRTYSVFGQLRWNITPQLELAAGARYSDEQRTETSYRVGGATPVQLIIDTPQVHPKQTTPDITLTYKPSADMTVFAAFRQAYKSGGYSMSSQPESNGHMNNAFGDEKATGGEGGVKSRWLDRRLLVNAAVYYYHYAGLQVGAIKPPQPGGLVETTVQNAGSAKSYGLDADATWYPEQVDGLSLNASLNWNKSTYIKLNTVPCYSGQTIAYGCTLALNPATGLFTAQDLSGTPFVRAPEWQANAGFSYEKPLRNGMKAIFTGNANYSSKYVTNLADRPTPDNYQKAFAKLDLSVTLASADDRLELALIGKNITDKITSGFCLNSATNINGGVFPLSVQGGTSSGPAGISYMQCYPDPGREVWVRVTYKPLG
jgi:iron complex outermembrane receptor protein